MGEKEKLVHRYELKQKKLKKENRTYRKKVPYYIIGFIFFALGLIMILDGKLNEHVGNSYNLILIIISITVLFFMVYLIRVNLKIRNNKKKSKDCLLKSGSIQL